MTTWPMRAGGNAKCCQSKAKVGAPPLCQSFLEGLGKRHYPPSEEQEMRDKNVAADEEKMDSWSEEQALCISQKFCKLPDEQQCLCLCGVGQGDNVIHKVKVSQLGQL